MSRQRSILQGLGVGLSITMVVVGLTIGIAYFQLSTRQATQRLEVRSQEQLSFLASALAINLWTFNTPAIGQVCEAFLQNELVTALRVTDEADRLVFARGTFQHPHLLLRSRPLRYQGRKIGMVKAGFSTLPLQRARANILITTLILVFGLVAASLAAVQVLLSRYLTQPLADLRHELAARLARREEEVREKTARLEAANAELTRQINERQQAEEEKHNLENQLRQAQKLEAIGTLAGGIAHDFNNILAAILGYAELTQLDLPAGGVAHQNITEVIKAANRAKNLVSQILTFSRKKSQELKPVPLAPLVKEGLRFLRASIPTTVNIQTDIAAGSDAVLGDPTLLHQVLVNLCSNAAQAMEKAGGTLSVRLARVELLSEVSGHDTTIPAGSYLALTVSDTGAGMDQATINRIFDPYFTTKAVGKGSGMGLAVVHGIVKQHHGAITVESAPGKGTTFTVYLPRTHGQPEPEPETSPGDRQADLPTGGERILLVDDEPAIVQTVQHHLESLGYQVEGFTGSREALARFHADPDRFALVITDQTMPGLTGLDLAEELRRLRPDLPVILCTGYSPAIPEQEALARGVRAYLMKPLSRQELAWAVRRVLDRWQGNRAG